VRRELLDPQPGVLPRQVGTHGAAAVGRKTVPEQQDLLAAEVPPQLFEELDQTDVVVGSGTGVKVEARPLAVASITERDGRATCASS
jgi:hypothetical protein